MHILIVSHYYPPLNVIASFRPASFAKYFVEQGINVTVLTTQKSEAEGGLDLEQYTHPLLNIVEVPYSQLKFWSKSKPQSVNKIVAAQPTSEPSLLNGTLVKIRKGIVASLGSLVDYQFFWIKPAIQQAISIHREQPVDLVLSSFGPPASHKIASSFKSKFPNVKWIADYRDLWSNRHIMTAKFLLNNLEKRIEKNTIRKVDHILTVSDPLQVELNKLVSNRVPVSVVYNGYNGDIAIENYQRVIQLSGPIQIVYTGTIYEGRSDPSPLFMAIREMESEGSLKDGQLKISFYGNRLGNLDDLILKYGVSKWVDIKGYVSHKQSLDVQREADFLLFLESNKPDARGVLTGKLFEYITTGTPILAVGVDQECASAKVLIETQTGEVLGNDVFLIKRYLKRVLAEKMMPNRNIAFDRIKEYSRTNQAKKVLDIVNQLVNNE